MIRASSSRMNVENDATTRLKRVVASR